jgi:hypothetical protein
VREVVQIGSATMLVERHIDRTVQRCSTASAGETAGNQNKSVKAPHIIDYPLCLQRYNWNDRFASDSEHFHAVFSGTPKFFKPAESKRLSGRESVEGQELFNLYCQHLHLELY